MAHGVAVCQARVELGFCVLKERILHEENSVLQVFTWTWTPGHLDSFQEERLQVGHLIPDT